MKTTEHIEYLLRQGKKPGELVQLGFPKQVITRVRRQLRQDKAVQQVKVPKGRGGAKGSPQPPLASGKDTVTVEQKLACIESYLNELKGRLELLEAAQADNVSIEDIEAFLDGTPALNLRNLFKCSCGTSGFLALHIQCTKCERETWWGWFPKQ